MLELKPLERALDVLEQIHKEGEQIFLDGFEGYTPSDLTLILIGNQKSKNPKTGIKDRLLVMAWMLKNAKDPDILGKLKHISGYIALSGATFDEDAVKQVVKESKYAHTLIKILSRGVSISVLAESSIVVNRVAQTAMTAYRKLNNHEYLKKELLEKVTAIPQDHYTQVKLSMLLQTPLNDEITQRKKVFSTADYSILSLFLSLNESKKKELVNAVLTILKTFEELQYCRGISPSKLMFIATKGECNGGPVTKFLEGNKVAKFPSQQDLIKVAKTLLPYLNESSIKLRAEFKRLSGEKARFLAIEYCDIKKYLEKGGSLYDAHSKYNPEIDIAAFYRAYKRWQNTEQNGAKK